jgi:hypothetical protein
MMGFSQGEARIFQTGSLKPLFSVPDARVARSHYHRAHSIVAAVSHLVQLFLQGEACILQKGSLKPREVSVS